MNVSEDGNRSFRTTLQSGLRYLLFRGVHRNFEKGFPLHFLDLFTIIVIQNYAISVAIT